MRVLLVEDTIDVAEAIVAHFQMEGHVCDHAENVADARHFSATGSYDLVVLDINLPDEPGLNLLEWLRRRSDRVPVLVLTARMAVDDKIDALDLGADDYLVKPFEFGELDARARAIIRRRQGEANAIIEAGNLRYDSSGRHLTINDRPVELTKRELIVLECFLANRNRVVRKEDLYARLFGLDGDAGINAVEVYVARLRRKLKGADIQIRALRGLGYQIMERPAEETS